MASNDSLKIQEVCKVAPFNDSSEPLTQLSLPLTLFDTFWFRFPPVERVFYYRLTDSSDPTSFNSIILPKLKHTLSLTLRHFLPLAGNLTWPSHAPQPFILYTPNDGVSLTVAESNSNFDRLSGTEPRDAIESHPLVPELSISEKTGSLLSLQVTLFPHQGFSIGLSTHHSILDGKTTTMFFKAWAYVCKTGKSDSFPPELTPFMDRAVVEDPEGLCRHFLENWAQRIQDPNPENLKVLPQLSCPKNLVRSTFELTREDIKKLREYVSSTRRNPEPTSLHLSTFVLTCAYTMYCIAKSRTIESNTRFWFGFTADVRARFDPPIPANYFGNCVATYGVSLEVEDILGADGVVYVAERIGELVKGMGKVDMKETNGTLEKFLDLEPGAVGVTVAGSPRFDVYGSDFGWGTPKRVEITSVDRTGAISLAESSDGRGGVEVGLALSDDKMEVFAECFAGGLKRGALITI